MQPEERIRLLMRVLELESQRIDGVNLSAEQRGRDGLHVYSRIELLW